MILIVCLDDQGGMAFNHRRQTRDSIQRKHMKDRLQGCTLFLSPYSEKLFLSDLDGVNCKVCDDYLSDAGDSDYVLAEIDDVREILPQTKEIWIYHWNREYLCDVAFPLEELQHFIRIEKEEWKGSSHDCITYEVYRR